MSVDKITLFMPSMSGGGAKRMFYNLAIEFDKLGFNVEFVVTETSGEYLNTLPQSIKIIVLPANRMLTSPPFLLKYIHTKEPDVFLTSITGPNLLGAICSILSIVDTRFVIRVPTAVSVDLRDSDLQSKYKVIDKMVKHLYPKTDRIIAISKGVKKDLVGEFNINPRLVDVVYNPAFNRDIIDQSNTKIEHEWFTNPEISVILGVGRLVEQKNFSQLIEAFSIYSENNNARLMILGEGNKRQELQSLISSCGLQNKAKLKGYVENPFPYMKHADVFVLSSKWEGFGNVIVEAMACGTTVVATDCPSGPAEVLDHGKYGYLTPVGDSKEMANKINKAILSPISKDKLNERAKEFKSEVIAKEYLSVFDKATQKSG